MAPTKTLDGSAFSFTTTRGHTTHISILWVFVLFTFLTVAVVLLGGYQEGLVERKFTNAKVTDRLEVTKGLEAAGPNPGFYTGMTTEVLTGTATLENNIVYTHDITGPVTFTLPEAKIGNRVVYVISSAPGNATSNI